MLYLGMKEGKGEGMIESGRYDGSIRFYSLYEDRELREIISENFDILHSSDVIFPYATYLNYLSKRK